VDSYQGTNVLVTVCQVDALLLSSQAIKLLFSVCFCKVNGRGHPR
jgi:hypothetical protein